MITHRFVFPYSSLTQLCCRLGGGGGERAPEPRFGKLKPDEGWKQQQPASERARGGRWGRRGEVGPAGKTQRFAFGVGRNLYS